jgi:hypothetical protein
VGYSLRDFNGWDFVLMPRVLVLALCAAQLLSAASAHAQTIVSPEAFEALSEGRTLHFSLDGQPFGSEQFFTGRRSLWRTPDGLCEAGVWRSEGDVICFEYDATPEPQCWIFLREGSDLKAERVEDGAPAGPAVDLSFIDNSPLPCPGPLVGT